MSDIQVPPAPPIDETEPVRPSLKPFLVGAALGLALGVAGTTSIMSSRADDQAAAAVRDERASVADSQSAQAEQAAAEEASETSRLDGLLTAAVESCDGPEGLSVSDAGRTLTFDMEGEDEYSGASVEDIVCVLLDLGVPTSVIANMEQTTAMDGRQSDDWDDFEMSWSYHPDRGLDGVITVAEE